MKIFLLIDWYYLNQQREQVQLVPDQVEIRFLNAFSDVVCLKLLMKPQRCEHLGTRV